MIVLMIVTVLTVSIVTFIDIIKMAGLLARSDDSNMWVFCMKKRPTFVGRFEV